MEENKDVVVNSSKIKKIYVLIPIIISVVLVLAICIFYKTQSNVNYEIETITKFSYFTLYENEKYGVIDDKGNILVEPKYDMLAIPNPSKPVFIGYFNYDSQKGEYETEVVNDKNQKILTKYEQVLPIMFKDALAEVPYEKSVLIYKEKDKFGITNFEGKKITKAIYDSVESLLYREGCLIVKQEDKYGVINIKGKIMVEIEYDSISADGYYDEETKYQRAGFIIGQKKDVGYRYGYINYNAQKILEVEYNEIDRITEITDVDDVYLLAFRNGQAGIYRNKNQIISHNYQEIEYNKQNQLFIVQKVSKQGVINREGKQILSPEYDNIMISDKIINAQKDDIIYSFDDQGTEITEQDKKTVITTENSNYFITINEDELLGITDKNGNVILENEYSYIEYAFSDFFIITKDGQVSVIDAQNKKVILSNYNVIEKIENKNALQVIISDPYTIEIYNKNIEKVASMKDANINVEDNYFELSSKTERKYFNTDGNEIQNTDIFTDLNLFAYRDEYDKWGFKNKSGNIVVEANYDMVTELNAYGFAGIKKDDKWGIINSNGEIILEPTYEIEWDDPEFIGPYVKLNFGYGMVYYTKQLTEE